MSNKTQVLTLALLAALGMSGTVFAQQATSGKSEKVVDQKAQEAVEDAEVARKEAEAAQAAAKAAAATRAGGATTAQGAAQATVSAQTADQASVQAQAAANEAVNSANEALAAKSAIEGGTAQPKDAAVQAVQAASATSAATAAASNAAATAEAAADATAQAVTAPPEPVPPPSPVASGMDTPRVIVRSVPGDPIKTNFAATDANGDSSIDRTEARADAGLTAKFKTFDKDRDGQLSYAEYETWRNWR